MIPKRLDEIAEADIQGLKDRGVEEGKTIEYKRELPGTRDEDKREFLGDISSFANTEGGDILYGVDEDQRVITDIVGVSSPDFEIEIQRLEHLIRDGISPRISAAFQLIPFVSVRLLVVRIERSWIGPHRVIFRGHDKFYARNSVGKFPLDVSQLRTAFLQSATLSERIEGFRVDRIIDIANDRGPVPLAKEPKLVLHIIPLGALSDELQFDTTIFHRNPVLHRPWNSNNWNPRMTFDGAMLQRSADRDGRVSSYTHFFRNGILEVVATEPLQTSHGSGPRLIPHASLEREVLEYLPGCFQSLQQLGVRPPVLVAMTLIGVKGLRISSNISGLPQENEIREETLVIPGTIVDDFSAAPGPILKPMFDRVWNACGLIESPNFDSQGNWRPARPRSV